MAVTFYGGEPLLRFPFIKSCVQYARKAVRGKDLDFSITTNATLITPRIARFLEVEGFGVHVSLDGPEDIHDKYRKDINGIGSFQNSISGLKMLYDAYGNKNNKITLSMVYAYPYSAEKIENIAEVWNKYSWLSRKIGLSISYAQGFYPPLKLSATTPWLDFSLVRWAQKEYIKNYPNISQSHPIAASVIEKEMARLVKRKTYSAPKQEYWLNGCCVPAARKLFVSVEGELSICERIGQAPAIGTVNDGIELDKISRIYVEEYAKESIASCSECWAVHICSICYVHAFSEGRINIQLKRKNCSAMRESTESSLSFYCRLLEINEAGLDYLQEWQTI